MAAHFDGHKTPGRRFVLDGTMQAVFVNKVMLNCATDMPILHPEPWFVSSEREDCAEGSLAEPVSNVTVILDHSEAHNFHFHTTQKTCGFWRSAF